MAGPPEFEASTVIELPIAGPHAPERAEQTVRRHIVPDDVSSNASTASAVGAAQSRAEPAPGPLRVAAIEKSTHAAAIGKSTHADIDQLEPRLPIQLAVPPTPAPEAPPPRIGQPAASFPRRAPGTAPLVRSHSRESSAPRSAEAPDVHIHIGRIELTALTPPAPRRPPPPDAKATPLNEYLQRRDRKVR